MRGHRPPGLRSARRQPRAAAAARRWWGRLALLSALGPATALAAAPGPPSIAFHYGASPPVALLAHFDRVVIEASYLAEADRERLEAAGSSVFAYVSVGELAPDRPLASALDPSLVLGQNPDFGGAILDHTRPGVRALLLERWLLPLWRAGYRRFFLDTLDAPLGAVAAGAAREAQRQALVATVRAIAERFPGVELLANRGFELLPEVAPLLCGVVAESLFRGYQPRAVGDPYREVPEEDRAWLLARLREVRERYRLPVTVIDYLPLAARPRMREVARRIAALGFAPWVAPGELDALGVGLVEAVPRRVLALWSRAEQDGAAEVPDVSYADVHQLAAMPLEHLGMAVDTLEATAAPPPGRLADRYAAVVTWFSEELAQPAATRALLARALDEGVRVVMLGTPGFELTREWLKRLGLRAPEVHLRGPLRLRVADALLGFEALARPRPGGPGPLALDGPGKSHLQLEDAQHHPLDAVITAPWGGLAFDPYLVEDGARGKQRWILDPFAFLTLALGLDHQPMPAPDVTTEDGRRLLIAHIDGDGFVSRAEMPRDDFAGKVILDEVLQRYRIPTTVSVVEGEIGARGRYPRESAQLEAIARDIFRLPHVEAASHTYSHPFDWLRLGRRQADGDLNGLFSCPDMKPPVDGCDEVDPARRALAEEAIIERDLVGSMDYINRTLAPPDRPARVLLWSGNALPSEAALARARAAGFHAMNGGETAATRIAPSLTNVSPMMRKVGAEVQVYAPVTNENIYTNLWRGPFYGFRDVLDTFRITGEPRRLKPMNIYYHFYSGTKIGALRALKSVYTQALAQDPKAIQVREYVERVLAFDRLTLSRRLDGSWQVRGAGALRTLRLPRELGEVDRAGSEGVSGLWSQRPGRYLGLDGRGRALIRFAAPVASGVVR